MRHPSERPVEIVVELLSWRSIAVWRSDYRRFAPNQPESSVRESDPHSTAAGPTSTMKRMMINVPMQ